MRESKVRLIGVNIFGFWDCSVAVWSTDIVVMNVFVIRHGVCLS